MGNLTTDSVLHEFLIGARILDIDDRRDDDGEIVLTLDSGRKVYFFTSDSAVIVDPETH